jgi:hypothetical protein
MVMVTGHRIGLVSFLLTATIAKQWPTKRGVAFDYGIILMNYLTKKIFHSAHCSASQDELKKRVSMFDFDVWSIGIIFLFIIFDLGWI